MVLSILNRKDEPERPALVSSGFTDAKIEIVGISRHASDHREAHSGNLHFPCWVDGVLRRTDSHRQNRRNQYFHGRYGQVGKPVPAIDVCHD